MGIRVKISLTHYLPQNFVNKYKEQKKIAECYKQKKRERERRKTHEKKAKMYERKDMIK